MRICLGGKLTKELLKTKISKLVTEWARAGFIDRVPDELVNSKADILSGSIESDDEHVVALAFISGCRLVYTNDEALIRDLKNSALLSPKGKVVKASTAEKYAHPLFERYGK